MVDLRYKINKNHIKKIIGRKIKKILRRSKYFYFILIKILLMLVHLGMTGKFFYKNKKKKNTKQVFIMI